jgi:hypothetical protein
MALKTLTTQWLFPHIVSQPANASRVRQPRRMARARPMGHDRAAIIPVHGGRSADVQGRNQTVGWVRVPTTSSAQAR